LPELPRRGESFSGTRSSIYLGEFGFILQPQVVGFAFRLEVLNHPTLQVSATDASGTPLYALSNDLTVVIPKPDLKWHFERWKNEVLHQCQFWTS